MSTLKSIVAGTFPVYVDQASSELIQKLGKGLEKGITATCGGFYGPQGRTLRLKPAFPDLISHLSSFEFNGSRVTNFEMETASIYALGRMLGHRCCSVNVLIANRIAGKFSRDPRAAVEQMIKKMLERISSI